MVLDAEELVVMNPLTKEEDDDEMSFVDEMVVEGADETAFEDVVARLEVMVLLVGLP